MKDADIVDKINRHISLLTVDLATVGDDVALRHDALSMFAVECNRLVAQRERAS